MLRPGDRLSCEMKKGAYLMASMNPTNRRPKDRMKFWGKIALFCARKKGASQDFTFESVKGRVRISPVTKITRKYLFSECGIWKKKRWQPFGILSVALKISELLPPYGPSGGIWTHGLMVPNHARYQLRYTRMCNTAIIRIFPRAVKSPPIVFFILSSLVLSIYWLPAIVNVYYRLLA